MNLSRCENGHFYDKEKFASCPHCANGAGAMQENDRTLAFTEDLGGMVTEPLQGQAAATPMPTAQQVSQAAEPIPAAPSPLGMPQAVPAAMPAQQPMTPIMPIPGTESALDATVTEEKKEEDDDHTVAFYDDLFAEAIGSAASPVANTQHSGASATAVARVTTPCVGWLIALGGVHIGQDFRLKVGKNFIGRDAKMDVVLDGDKSVSRNKHAIIVYEPKQHLYLIQPGESSELVYRNNTVVLSPTPVEAYDMITIGEVNLLFMPLCGEKFNWSDLLKSQSES